MGNCPFGCIHEKQGGRRKPEPISGTAGVCRDEAETVEPDREDAAGFDAYTLNIRRVLQQKAAVEALR